MSRLIKMFQIPCKYLTRENLTLSLKHNEVSNFMKPNCILIAIKKALDKINIGKTFYYRIL